MNYSTFIIDAPTFSAEFVFSDTTHRVVSAAPVISWLAGIDRFSLFRLCAKRDWHVKPKHIEPNEKPGQLLQTLSDSFSTSHAAARSFEDRASGE